MYTYRDFTSRNCPPELYAFRYKIYVEEMARTQADADHERKIIKDALDDTAHHAIVFFDEQIAACMRVNFLREGSVGKYEKLYGLDKLSAAEIDGASICTRLMVDKAHRHRHVTVAMLQFIYAYGLKNGITTCYMDCNKPLQRFFEKFGYYHITDAMHPDYGRVSVMKLDLHNIEYLRSLKSPFAAAYDIAKGDFPGLEMSDVANSFQRHPSAKVSQI